MMRIDDPYENPLIPVAYFGGAPKAPKPVKIPKPKPIEIPPPPPMPKFEMPKPLSAEEIKAMMPPPPPPPTPIPPPPTTSPIEATEVADEEKKKQSRRQGMAASIIAGEKTQDYQSSATPTGSLLG